MKTNSEILDDIKSYLKESELASEITGVITDLDRPKNSKKEDCCLSVLSNQPGQLQIAILNVNIYVQDVMKNNQMVENKPRTRKLQRLCGDILERYHGGAFRIDSDSQTCFKVEGTDEHEINVKIIYKTVNY